MDRGRSGHQTERHAATAYVELLGRIAGGEREGGRCGGQRGLHNVATDPNHRTVDCGSGIGEQLGCVR